MPWKIVEKDGKYCLYKLGADDQPTGEAIHCHASHAEAVEQMQALYASEGKAVKFANAEETEIEGVLAPYGGPFNGKDVTGEFFSAKTNFALDWFPPDARPLLFHHGLEPKAGLTVVGRMKALSQDEAGLWMRAQLDAHNEYYDAIKELIKQGKLGLSSGSMRHLVEVAPKSGEILRWPLIEGSLTPTPANPLAEVDFAAAKSHYKALGLELPELDALKAKLTAAQEKDLPDSDFAYIDSEGGRHLPIHDEAHVRNALARFNQAHFESDEAKEKAKKKIVAAARRMDIEVSEEGKSVLLTANTVGTANSTNSIAVSGNAFSLAHLRAAVSWETVRRECDQMLNAQIVVADPFSEHAYGYVEETYSDHIIACIYRDSIPHYYRISFTMGEDGHVNSMGQAEEVEQTYVPVKPPMSVMPMTMHAEMAKTYATSLLERTKDLQERRVKEGRMLSTANRKALSECLDGMRKACDEMQHLLDSAEPQPAKAASVRLQFDLLRLYAATMT